MDGMSERAAESAEAVEALVEAGGGGDAAAQKTQQERTVLFKDQWCATPIASLAIPAVAADLAFSDVVLPAGFLESGAVIQAVYLLLKWRKQVDSSAAPNAIAAAAKTVRVKKSSGAWNTDDVVGITFADNQLATGGSATEGGDMIVGDADISSEVDDADTETYNVASRQTGRTDAPIVDGASLTLHDVYTGMRVYFTLA